MDLNVGVDSQCRWRFYACFFLSPPTMSDTCSGLRGGFLSGLGFLGGPRPGLSSGMDLTKALDPYLERLPCPPPAVCGQHQRHAPPVPHGDERLSRQQLRFWSESCVTPPPKINAPSFCSFSAGEGRLDLGFNYTYRNIFKTKSINLLCSFPFGKK